ncbi:hypothetical protein ACIQTW_05770 [Paenarthrobacter sp. NPDC090517]|uniref:hypothetical protein n=1 Tax=Paenarthrobacter sp. NPDC090517 TaxID=3364381 RepID=UPI0037FAC413
MKGSRVFPRATSILRSVMVAGAGTAIWMALSASAASADTGTSDKSLLGNVASSSSVNVAVPDVPLPAVAQGLVPAENIKVHVPAVTPLVENVSGTVDHVVSAVPVGNQLVPPNTAGTVVNTVVVPATDIVDHTVDFVVPPVNQVLEPARLEPVTDAVNPVLEPVVGVVDTVLAPVEAVVPPVTVPPVTVPPVVVPPVTTPPVGDPGTSPVSEIPSAPGTDISEVPATADAGALANTDVVNSGATLPEPSNLDDHANLPGVAIDVSASLTSNRNFGPTGITAVLGGTSSAADPASPSRLPTDPAIAPAGLTGAGSGNSQNGPPSPAAAFLHDALIIPVGSLPGLESADAAQHPKPVCFDPGSSPD